jgi:hypothetical protein
MGYRGLRDESGTCPAAAQSGIQCDRSNEYPQEARGKEDAFETSSEATRRIACAARQGLAGNRSATFMSSQTLRTRGEAQYSIVTVSAKFSGKR